jgi:hypothetical protein
MKWQQLDVKTASISAAKAAVEVPQTMDITAGGRCARLVWMRLLHAFIIWRWPPANSSSCSAYDHTHSLCMSYLHENG